MLGCVPGDPLERHCVVENQVGKEAPVLVAAGRIVRKVEPVHLEVLPEQLGRQGVVKGPVLDAAVGALEGPSNRIARFPMAQLHE